MPVSWVEMMRIGIDASNIRNVEELIMKNSMFFFMVSVFLFFPSFPAHAYIDPGTGSMALQFLLAFVFSGLFYFRKIYSFVFSAIKKLIRSSKSTK